MESDLDVGPDEIAEVAQSLSVDPEWSQRTERSLTWWPYRLEQRIWAEPARNSHGYRESRVLGLPVGTATGGLRIV